MTQSKYVMILSFLIISINIYAQSHFDVFSYKAPDGFMLKESNGYLCYEKTEGKNYCQLFLYPAVKGKADVEKDFETNWDFFARNPDHKIGDPETKEADSLNGWQMIFGGARGSVNQQMFAVTVSTFTKKGITYFTAAVFTDQKFIPIAQEFIASVVPNEEMLSKKRSNKESSQSISNLPIATSSSISKATTTFNDGWTAKALNDYVKVTNADTELRMHYTDKALHDAIPNTVDAPEYYWSKYVK
jgi:hypothetical protein